MDSLHLDALVVTDFVASFLGFGDPRSPWWFLSYNPHYGRERAIYYLSYTQERAKVRADLAGIEMATLLALWQRSGALGARSIDLSEYAASIERPLDHLAPNSFGKRQRLAELYCSLEANNCDPEAFKMARRDLGTNRARAFLAELNGVDRASYYSLLRRYPNLEWRRHGYLRSFRTQVIQSAIERYQPRLVYCFGTTGRRYWERLTDAQFVRHDGPSWEFYDTVRIAHTSRTIFAYTRYPASPWMRADTFQVAARQIVHAVAQLNL